MMRSKRLHFITIILASFVFFSCTRETEQFTSEPLSDYIPLQVGKYITYRLDSTVFLNFGTVTAVHSYQEKHVIDAQITDAAGMTSYRILRFIRDTAGTQPWMSAGTYFITPTDKTIEVIENNMRFIKLVLPIALDYTWKGNRYLVSWNSDTLLLSDKPFSSLYSFSNDDGMKDWDYTYSSIGSSLTVNGQTYNNVLNVTGINDVSVADTLEVNGNNQVQISDSMKSVYLRGSASNTITITALPPKLPGALSIYNRSNAPAKLGTIDIPVGGGKTFEYINNAWTYGYVDVFGVRRDTVFTDLPYGFKNIMIDKYAKGVGLVYQEFTMWEYQYSYSTQIGATVGFGVKRSIIDHN